jgi:hypothetical protein
MLQATYYECEAQYGSRLQAVIFMCTKSRTPSAHHIDSPCLMSVQLRLVEQKRCDPDDTSKVNQSREELQTSLLARPLPLLPLMMQHDTDKKRSRNGP